MNTSLKLQKGKSNALLMKSIFYGETHTDVNLTLCPCLHSRAMIMSKTELSDKQTAQFIRNIMDCDKKIRTYVHNRLISKSENSTFIFIGNYLNTYDDIYGILLLPNH